MKNGLVFFISLVVILPFTSIEVTGQSSLDSYPSTFLPKPAKFIENIEIGAERGNSPSSAPNEFQHITSNIIPSFNPPAGSIEQCTSWQFKYAQLLNREVEVIGNMTLFGFIDEWWATRYRYGGLNKSGIDCSAFTGKLLSQVYCTDLPRTAREQFNACEKISRENMKEGDLLFFNTRGGVSHVGVYLENGYFVHASTSIGVTINNLEEDYYRSRFIGAGRVKKSEAINDTATN